MGRFAEAMRRAFDLIPNIGIKTRYIQKCTGAPAPRLVRQP